MGTIFLANVFFISVCSIFSQTSTVKSSQKLLKDLQASKCQASYLV